MPRLCLISDTHGRHWDLKLPPDIDILVHAGDFTQCGSPEQIVSFAEWLRQVECKDVVVIAGNHDLLFQDEPERAQRLLKFNAKRRLHFLMDEEATVQGLRFYGSPWTPFFCDWAFNLKRGDALRQVWRKIPEGLDVLVTHGPPFSVGDMVSRHLATENVGCVDLRHRIWEVKPRVHVCGHIHEGYGQRELDGLTYINCSVLDERYALNHQPIVLDLPLREKTG